MRYFEHRVLLSGAEETDLWGCMIPVPTTWLRLGLQSAKVLWPSSTTSKALGPLNFLLTISSQHMFSRYECALEDPLRLIHTILNRSLNERQEMPSQKGHRHPLNSSNESEPKTHRRNRNSNHAIKQ